MLKKIGRNDICPCGSGIKYKYCCISKIPRTRLVNTHQKCSHCEAPLHADLTEDWFNKFVSHDIPLKNFCKDNKFYYFGIMKLKEHLEVIEKLNQGTLSKSDIIEAYKVSMSEDQAIALIADGCNLHQCFEKRRKIICDAVHAHFAGLYTLSIPTFFAQIEGLLRDYGGLQLKDKFKSTIPKESWNQRLLFHVTDNAEYFNGFIELLFEGGQHDDKFNRNPILHGMNIDYHSEEWSLLLLLTILEIRLFIWYEKHTKEQFCKG